MHAVDISLSQHLQLYGFRSSSPGKVSEVLAAVHHRGWSVARPGLVAKRQTLVQIHYAVASLLFISSIKSN